MPKQNPINITMIDHVVIRANDLSKMLEFYRDILCCQIERNLDDLKLVQLRAGNSLIDLLDAKGPLGQKGGGAPRADGHNMDHLCLQVEPWDLDDIQCHLEEHGVEIGDVASRYGALGNGPSIYIKDPEGNTVELKGPPEN